MEEQPGTSNDLCGEEEEEMAGHPLRILSLPEEVLEIILRYMTFREISKYRLVCKRFDQVGQHILNKTFFKLQNKILQRFQMIKNQMPRRESLRRKHPLARECDIVETLHMRLTLLQMTFGKHIERKHCCFFAGEVLDEIFRILGYIKVTESPARAYKVTDELFDLSTMALEYFKEHVEGTLPEVNYFAAHNAADLQELASNITSPAPKTIQFSLPVCETPQPTTPKIVLQQAGSLSSSTASLSHYSNKITNLRNRVRSSNIMINHMRKEIKTCKQKLEDQQRQIAECNSKLDQYDRQFVEQDRKFNALMQEFQTYKSEFLENTSVKSSDVARLDVAKSTKSTRLKGGDVKPKNFPGTSQRKRRKYQHQVAVAQQEK